MNPPEINTSKESQKIIDFIKQTFKENNKSTAVVALSGGIDSATSLILASKALGSENIFPLHLPSKTTNPKSTKDVLELLESASINKEKLTTIHIGSIIQKTWRAIKNYSGSETHFPKETKDKKKKNQDIARLNRIRLANFAARTRMMMIYDHAKRTNSLVVGTENYSEHLLGYYTRFGDEASDLEPIKHLYKTQIGSLAKHLGIPKSILEKAPSADLWSGQTDEKELGFSYEQADPILYLNDQGKSKHEIIERGFEKDIVKKVLKQVQKNSFKHKVPYKIEN
ncbi:NAD+ synthase [Patescibacteria group bacterium]